MRFLRWILSDDYDADLCFGLCFVNFDIFIDFKTNSVSFLKDKFLGYYWWYLQPELEVDSNYVWIFIQKSCRLQVLFWTSVPVV